MPMGCPWEASVRLEARTCIVFESDRRRNPGRQFPSHWVRGIFFGEYWKVELLAIQDVCASVRARLPAIGYDMI